ncbi:hypothetical protein B0H14DRAFT_3517429 [Mycena olivaceomarginata]|nr:hypothetical protein B0H14DRAFT_3517429 [Mycena olivaceomarginata]
MHAIVDAIPFLFHASLLLFFAGLVTFLLPANHIMCIALVIVLLLYAALPVPLVIRLDRPYRPHSRQANHRISFPIILQSGQFDISDIILWDGPTMNSRICIGAETLLPSFEELLRLLSPLFLPTDVDIPTWTGKFKKKKNAAILAYTQSFEPRYASGWGAVQKKLWSCDLFWVWLYRGGQSPSLDGIELSCLQLLREALELYQAAAVGAQLKDEIQMDTTSSTKLLAGVEKIF